MTCQPGTSRSSPASDIRFPIVQQASQVSWGEIRWGSLIYGFITYLKHNSSERQIELIHQAQSRGCTGGGIKENKLGPSYSTKKKNHGHGREPLRKRTAH